MYYTYVLKSLKDGRLCKGCTNDINGRFTEHNAGHTKSTAGFRPWELVYSESFATEQEARKRELFFKSGQGREFLKSFL
jgi:putative endonuclease